MSGVEGIYYKQNRKTATGGRPLYARNDESDAVIAWDGKHWWITDTARAGTNSGNIWLQQDQDDHCPGAPGVIAYERITCPEVWFVTF